MNNFGCVWKERLIKFKELSLKINIKKIEMGCKKICLHSKKNIIFFPNELERGQWLCNAFSHVSHQQVKTPLQISDRLKDRLIPCPIKREDLQKLPLHFSEGFLQQHLFDSSCLKKKKKVGEKIRCKKSKDFNFW